MACASCAQHPLCESLNNCAVIMALVILISISEFRLEDFRLRVEAMRFRLLGLEALKPSSQRTAKQPRPSPLQSEIDHAETYKVVAERHDLMSKLLPNLNIGAESGCHEADWFATEPCRFCQVHPA